MKYILYFCGMITKTIDKIEKRPYLCEDCKYFVSGLKCKAFDFIPLEIFDNPEGHTVVVPGQNGNYVFETNKTRDTMRVYGEAL